ncbi:1-aminocyclopropane-1-carboxylate deaminase/D-cysteine desulfhydrase [Neoaquamicrobium sediminum]|uniref:1-aminocyclopropane-1-carboxylate deaminase/D-cysteine desulfhydrase n=1 Tax=Neoaquamicrobium sediminum TaxID=1849104 RepID=UPI0015679D3D|nr:pyridoxal-phosphate dependent enzyme [Mesorhizobium sediminum]NRC57346.1 pyridoxal-phosphate dependent enzyme [Mesorhizobium sediminum]
MTLDEIEEIVRRLPREPIGFYPTPFHKAKNISRKYGVDIYLKREDLSGPSAFSGSKIRLAEFVIGEALRDGVTHILTVGAYLSNSAGQLATAAIQAGLTPILFLYDSIGEGYPSSWRANLLLDKILGVETYLFPREPDQPQEKIWKDTLYPAVEKKAAELEALGHKVLFAPAGATHPSSFPAHVLTYKEIMDQSRELNFKPDYIYHTTGTGSVLPAFAAARMLTDDTCAIRSIAINSYRPDNFVNTDIIAERVREIFATVGRAPPPSANEILAEFDIDQRFIGPDYAVPSAEGIAATRELASLDGIFLGPVYTAKGFAGLLSHIHEGRIAPGSKVVFVHTGDTNNLFEDSRITGQLVE